MNSSISLDNRRGCRREVEDRLWKSVVDWMTTQQTEKGEHRLRDKADAT